MLKAPREGKVKTRLAAALGNERAVEAYRRLVLTQVANLPEEFEAVVAFDPKEAGEEMKEWLGDRFGYLPQCEGDLGERLTAAARTALANDAPGALFLGGDCPELTADRIRDAVIALCDADVVLIPATDGGYCLIGLSSLRGLAALRDIPWSTREVLRATLVRCEQAGLSTRVLEPALEDVDDLASWERAIASGSMQSPR